MNYITDALLEQAKYFNNLLKTKQPQQIGHVDNSNTNEFVVNPTSLATPICPVELPHVSSLSTNNICAGGGGNPKRSTLESLLQTQKQNDEIQQVAADQQQVVSNNQNNNITINNNNNNNNNDDIQQQTQEQQQQHQSNHDLSVSDKETELTKPETTAITTTSEVIEQSNEAISFDLNENNSLIPEEITESCLDNLSQSDLIMFDDKKQNDLDEQEVQIECSNLTITETDEVFENALEAIDDGIVINRMSPIDPKTLYNTAITADADLSILEESKEFTEKVSTTQNIVTPTDDIEEISLKEELLNQENLTINTATPPPPPLPPPLFIPNSKEPCTNATDIPLTSDNLIALTENTSKSLITTPLSFETATQFSASPMATTPERSFSLESLNSEASVDSNDSKSSLKLAEVKFSKNGTLERQQQQQTSVGQQTPSTIQKTGLQVLILWNNRLTGNCSNPISNLLAKSSTLEILNVGRNVLRNDFLSNISTSLKTNTSLTSLGLQGAHLSCNGVKTLADILEFGCNSTLQRIDLRDNNLQVAGLTTLNDVLKSNKTVTQIDLDDMPRRDYVSIILITNLV